MQGAKYLETTIFYIGFEHNIPTYQGRTNKIISGQGKCKNLNRVNVNHLFLVGFTQWVYVYLQLFTQQIWTLCLLIFFHFKEKM